MTDATGGSGTDNDWFYTLGGQRMGPIPAIEIRELLTARKLDGDTPVWRKGWTDWKPLHQSELAAGLGEEPPPVAAAHINNAYVWVLAIAPLLYLIIEVVIRSYQLSRPWEDHSALLALTWIIPIVGNAGLCLLDESQLKKAGYASGWITFFAVVLAPVYLFVRAQRLKQRPTYGFVWIACFVVSLLLRGA